MTHETVKALKINLCLYFIWIAVSGSFINDVHQKMGFLRLLTRLPGPDVINIETMTSGIRTIIVLVVLYRDVAEEGSLGTHAPLDINSRTIPLLSVGYHKRITPKKWMLIFLVERRNLQHLEYHHRYRAVHDLI